MNGSTHEFAVRVVCGIRLLVDILPLSVFPGVGDQPLVYSVWAFYSFQLFCRCVVVCSVRRDGGDLVGCVHLPHDVFSLQVREMGSSWRPRS